MLNSDKVNITFKQLYDLIGPSSTMDKIEVISLQNDCNMKPMKSEKELREARAKCIEVCHGRLPSKECPFNINKEEDFMGTFCYDCSFSGSISWVLNEKD